MKKLKILVATVLTAILVFALASCGAGGALSGYVNAVKNGDMTKAATFVVDGKADEDDNVNKEKQNEWHLYKKTIGSFSYKVEKEEEKENDAGEVTSVEIEISWEVYSVADVGLKIGMTKVASGDYTKEDVDNAIKLVDKKTGTTTVTVEKNAEGKFLLTQASASSIQMAMTGVTL